MNQFFSPASTENTLSIAGRNLTAQEVAKIILLQKRHFYGFDKDSFLSISGAKHAVAYFFFGDGEETANERQAFNDTFSRYEEAFNENNFNTLSDAIEICGDWTSQKLYTCLKKNQVNTELKTIDVDKVAEKLNLEIPMLVRDRLEQITCERDSDGDWVFICVNGRSFYDTATEGILYSLRYAINFEEQTEERMTQALKDGYTTFEEVCNRMYIKQDKLTTYDRTFIENFLANTEVKPTEYTVYWSSHSDFCITETDGAEDKYNFEYSVKDCKTKAEAVEFMNTINDAWIVQKRRNTLAKQIDATMKQLQEMEAQYAEMCGQQ